MTDAQIVGHIGTPSAGTLAATSASDSQSAPSSEAADAVPLAYDALRAERDALQREAFALDRVLSALVASLGGRVTLPSELVDGGFPVPTTLAITPLPETGVHEVSVTAFDEHGVKFAVGVRPKPPLLTTLGTPAPCTPGGIVLATH